MHFGVHPLLVITAVAVAAPLLADVRIGVRLPVVVLEVLLGLAVGPHVLGLVQPDGFVSMMTSLGTAAMLFMAGMEIDFAQIRGRPANLALAGWVVSLAVAYAAVSLLRIVPDVHAPLMVTLALTTTGLGALLPILKDEGRLHSPFGRMLMAAGTVGEVAPIVATSLVLSSGYSTVQEMGFLLIFLLVVAVAVVVGLRARPNRLVGLLARGLHASTQLPVRMALLLLALMSVLAESFGFEGILGAFAAGLVVGLVTRGPEGKPFRHKIDAVCFGWFTPFFFIGTGLGFDPTALAQDPSTLALVPLFLLLLLLARGAPVLLYRSALPKAERWSFALSSSVTSLGLVVVITQIGLHSQRMRPEIAQALLGASLLSLLVFPILSGILLGRASADSAATTG